MKRNILTAAAAAVISAGLVVAPGPSIVAAQALAASSADQPSASDDWVRSEERAAPEQETVPQDQGSVEIDNGNSPRTLDSLESNHRKYFKHLKNSLDESQRKHQEIFEKVERNIRANPPIKPWNPFPPADGASH